MTIIYWLISSIIVSILSIYIMSKEDFNIYQAGVFVFGSCFFGWLVLPIIIIYFVCCLLGKCILWMINKIINDDRW